jgi:hypothetical protein
VARLRRERRAGRRTDRSSHLDAVIGAIRLEDKVKAGWITASVFLEQKGDPSQFEKTNHPRQGRSNRWRPVTGLT